MNRIAIFHFELKSGEPLKLQYHLPYTSLLDRWISIVERRKATNDSIELKISNKTLTDLELLMSIINEIIDKINSYYDKQLPIYTSTTEINANTLNHLHEEFELYGERQEKNPDLFPGEEFHHTWLRLNEYIHILETAIDTGPFPQFSCLVQYEPFERGDTVTSTDKLFLDTDFTWGQLYLGYNTLGKDWQHVMEDDDTRVITNNMIKFQETFCSEAWLNFSDSSRNAHKSTERQFWKWYIKQSPELQSKIPIDNLLELALGRYYLGVIALDETFLNFHPNKEDWLVPYSELRKSWNLEVFTKIKRAIDIEII